jgi:uncharacterized protein YcbK (DUF882 family)
MTGWRSQRFFAMMRLWGYRPALGMAIGWSSLSILARVVMASQRGRSVDFAGAEGMSLPAQEFLDASKPKRGALAWALFAPLLICVGVASNSTESAIANGETRTINLSDAHTNEAGAFTYMVNGVYDSTVLEKLNWFMRDWRHDEKTNIDPKLFDILWEVYRESGSTQPVDVLSGYRSPETNAMLRRRSRQVAEHSQHILGKAMDAHFLDVPTAKIRDIAMRLQAGGVGFYPTGNTPWVHLDAGSVRYWPRMSHDQIARLFPDGKTVFIPSDGVPLSGYQQAAAEIEARGGAVYAASAEAGGSKSLLSMLFGGGEDEQEENALSQGGGMAAPASARSGGGAQTFFTTQYQVASGAPDPIAKAKRDLPRGETYMSAPDSTPTAAVAQKPQVVAELRQPTASDADDPGAAAAQLTTPLPPRRPSEFPAPEIGFADAPTPPVRPVEFASLQTTAPDSAYANMPSPPAAAGSLRKRDLIAALLARKLPGVITQGAGGAIPTGALALAEVEDPPEAPGRPAPLTKAAALSAALPQVAAQQLPPLTRAALLSVALPTPHAGPKAVLIAARIDRSNFSAMTAAPVAEQGSSNGAPRVVATTPGAHPPDLLLAMLTPSAPTHTIFAARPYGDLRFDAFAGSATKAPDDSSVVGEAVGLRTTSD